MNRREFNRSMMLAAGMPFTQRNSATQSIRTNGTRLNRNLQELSQFGRNPQGGVTRVAYSDADLKARAFAQQLMRDARLAVRIDAAGNIIGTRDGSQPGFKPIIIGSHIDSVPEGGNYDGDVGSMAAIEVAHTLSEKSVQLRHPLEVIIFQNEEGGTMGSRAITSGLTPQDLEFKSNSGHKIRDGIRLIGGDADRLSSAIKRKGDAAAYLELHIEQGGILFQRQINIGVVEGIVGVYWWDVIIDGFANHAGTTPMSERKDALLAAARYVEAVRRIATSVPGRQVGTVGKIQAFPGAYNVVPGRVLTSLDLRDLDAAKVESLFEQIEGEVRQIEKATGTRFEFRQTNSTPPAPTDEGIRRSIEETARELGLTSLRMPSGAGHDAQEMAHIAPIGMIFVPSVDGISHSPRELTRPDDVTNGGNTQLQTLLRLDQLLGAAGSRT